jgi:hypothetical protein
LPACILYMCLADMCQAPSAAYPQCAYCTLNSTPPSCSCLTNSSRHSSGCRLWLMAPHAIVSTMCKQSQTAQAAWSPPSLHSTRSLTKHRVSDRPSLQGLTVHSLKLKVLLRKGQQQSGSRSKSLLHCRLKQGQIKVIDCFTSQSRGILPPLLDLAEFVPQVAQGRTLAGLVKGFVMQVHCM